MKKRILLNYNEKAYNELIINQEKAGKEVHDLVGYCEETLEIEIKDLKALMKDPKNYCLSAYWDKYGSQFGSAPVKKEKAFELTGWNDAEADQYFNQARIAVNKLAGHQYEYQGSEITFKEDPDDFKTYLRDEDQEMYDLALEFIEVAKKLEAAGSKPIRNFAQYSDILMIDGETLAPSKIYFTSTGRMRKDLSQYWN